MKRIPVVTVVLLALPVFTFGQTTESSTSHSLPTRTVDGSVINSTLYRQLASAKATKEEELDRLLTLLKPRHPDVLDKRNELDAVVFVMRRLEAGGVRAVTKEGLADIYFRAEAQLEKMKSSYRSAHPDVIAKQSEVDKIKVALRVLAD